MGQDNTTTGQAVYVYTTRKEARKGSKALSQGDQDYGTARMEDGTWVALPVGYLEGVEDTGEGLPATLEALEEDVGLYLEVVRESLEVTAQEVEAHQEEEAQEEAQEEAPTLSPEREAQLRARMLALRKELEEVEGELATAQVHILVTSTVDGPVAVARKVFMAYVREDGTPGVRKEVVRRLVNMGVAPNTAKTQYQVSKKALEEGAGWAVDLLAQVREAGEVA